MKSGPGVLTIKLAPSEARAVFELFNFNVIIRLALAKESIFLSPFEKKTRTVLSFKNGLKTHLSNL